MYLVKLKAKKFLKCMTIIVTMIFGIMGMFNPLAVSAKTLSSAPADSLTIRVGYSNGTYTLAKVFTDSDFSGAVKGSYSAMDSLPSPCMDAAMGVPLKDLLSQAGIDFNKVDSLSFYTTDVSGGPYKTMTKSFLYSTNKYYYPNIMKAWNADTQTFTDQSGASTTEEAISDRESVEPMIAITNNWVRGGMAPDFSNQVTDEKYRLLVGQPKDPATISAPFNAKWIYQIDVTLSGTDPNAGGSGTGSTGGSGTGSAGTTTTGTTSNVSVTGVTLNENSATITAGKTEQLTATVSPSDASNKNVTWSSNNTSVATVNSNGLVTAVGNGTAKITVNTNDGSHSAECIVTVDGQSTTPITTPTTSSQAIQREYGQNRIDTSIAIAKATYENKVSNVVLAASDNYPDALSGSVLAYKLKAPILLVGKDDADEQKIIDYMKSNMDSTGTVYILGGNGSVGSDMETKANAAGFKNINRIGGADRYETSVKIADTVGVKQGTPLVIVSGESYPDALSVSSAAAVKQYPILMVRSGEIPDVIKKEISALKPSQVFIIGLQGAVSTEVENQVAQTAAIDKTSIVRIGGDNRFETSLKLAQYFGLSGSKICVSSGNDFPDALAGSSYAANNNAPIILCGSTLSDNEKSYLKTAKVSGVTIFGGEGAVNKDVENSISQLINK